MKLLIAVKQEYLEVVEAARDRFLAEIKEAFEKTNCGCGMHAPEGQLPKVHAQVYASAEATLDHMLSYGCDTLLTELYLPKDQPGTSVDRLYRQDTDLFAGVKDPVIQKHLRFIKNVVDSENFPYAPYGRILFHEWSRREKTVFLIAPHDEKKSCDYSEGIRYVCGMKSDRGYNYALVPGSKDAQVKSQEFWFLMMYRLFLTWATQRVPAEVLKMHLWGELWG